MEFGEKGKERKCETRFRNYDCSSVLQVLLSLSFYVARSYYMQKTLYYLFHLTQGLPDPRHDVITLLFPVMKRHRALPVQLAATACLYNLIRQELSAKIHPSCLSQGGL